MRWVAVPGVLIVFVRPMALPVFLFPATSGVRSASGVVQVCQVRGRPPGRTGIAAALSKS